MGLNNSKDQYNKIKLFLFDLGDSGKKLFESTTELTAGSITKLITNSTTDSTTDSITDSITDSTKLNIELSNSVKTSCVSHSIFLINKGADVNYIDADGISIIYHAIKAKQSGQVSNLMKHNIDKLSIQNIFIHAIKTFNIDIISYCIDYCGFNHNEIDESGVFLKYKNDILPPLCYSVIVSNINESLFTYLVNHPRTNINALSLMNKTALYYASKYGITNCVDTLLCLGARINLYSITGKCCIIRAIEKHKIICIMLLIKHSHLEDINHQTSDGKTVIIHTFEHKLYDIVNYLIYRGADLTIRCAKGLNIFDYAKKYDLEKDIRRLANMYKRCKNIELTFLSEGTSLVDDTIDTKSCVHLQSIKIKQDSVDIVEIPDIVNPSKPIYGSEELSVNTPTPTPTPISTPTDTKTDNTSIVSSNCENTNSVTLIDVFGSGNPYYCFRNKIDYMYNGKKYTMKGDFEILFYSKNIYHMHPLSNHKIKIIDSMINYIDI